MPNKHQLQAQKRSLSDKPKVIRQQEKVLANVFGKGDSQAVTLPLKDTLKLLTEVGESTVIYLSIDGGKDIPVMITETQRDPIRGSILHLALRQVDLKQKVKAMISISVTGEFNLPGAVYLLVKDEVEAEALPTDLPEEFVVDLAQFKEIGQQFTFADLDYDRSKISLEIEHENEPIVVINEVKEEIEGEPVVEETTAVTEGASADPSAPSTEEKSSDA